MIEQVVERQQPPPEQGRRSEAALVRVLYAEGAVEGSPEDVTEPLGSASLREGMFPRDPRRRQALNEAARGVLVTDVSGSVLVSGEHPGVKAHQGKPFGVALRPSQGLHRSRALHQVKDRRRARVPARHLVGLGDGHTAARQTVLRGHVGHLHCWSARTMPRIPRQRWWSIPRKTADERSALRCGYPWRRCRSETGVPSRPRAFSPCAVRGTRAGARERHRSWFRASARCRPEAGVPSRPRAFSPCAVRGTRAGGRERHRSWFRASARCRSETGVPSRPRACSPCAGRGAHGGRREHHRYWFRAPARCRPEVGVPSRPRAFPTSAARRRGPAGRCADRRSAFQAYAPRCRSEGPHRENWLAFPCLRRHLGRPAVPDRRPPWAPAGSSTPVGRRTALRADRRRWKSPAAESRSCWSRWSRCSGRSSRG